MIKYDKQKKFFHLQTPNSSYVMRLYGEYILEHVYWGKRLEDLTGVSGSQNTAIEFSACDDEYVEMGKDYKITTENYPQEYSFFGSCDLRKAAFHAAYENGSRITKMKYVCHKIYKGKPKLEGLPATYTEKEEEADTLEIIMHDELTGLTLLYRYTAFCEYDAICRNVEVFNEGKNCINLQSVMSCNVDFNRDDFDFINLSGMWTRERHIERRKVHTGTTKIESLRGSSSHHNSPFFALADHNADEEYGNVYGFSFVYSGNFEAGIQVDSFGQTRAFMGINSFDFNWRLEPDQKFVTPEVVMVYSGNGLGEMSRIYHKLYQKRLARGVWRDKERPILINNWEATYFDFDEDKIANIAACAKKAGMEMLVLDDGWFGKRNSDVCSLGDWHVNTEKLKNGISGLAKRINDIGMKFGLWFEPEMISRDSDLYRAHPDWCLHVEGRKSSESRNQLILDLSRKDVQDYIITFMSEHLSSAPIAYVKWDMNRNMSCVGSAKLPPERQAEVYHRYILGLYRVLETLVNQFPEVLFEGCSGGGGRFDPGQMHFFNQYWTSDNTDAVERMYIQHGTSVVMPSAFMGAHVSAVPNHQVNRITSLKTRGYVAMNGQLGYELDVTKMSEKELLEIAEQIRQYKEVREIIHNGEMYRTHSPFETNHTGWMYVSEDKSKAVMFYFTIQNKSSKLPKRIKAKGLNKNMFYQLQSTGEIFSGDVLMNYGVHIMHNGDAEGSMYYFEEIKREETGELENEMEPR